MPNLVERRHRETRIAIADAATAVFTSQGFDETTMNDIAAAAGVSRRTVYRHFPTKEDLAFDHPRRWLEHFETAIADRQDQGSVKDLIEFGVLEVARHIQETAASVHAAWLVVAQNEGLRGANSSVRDAWTMRYLELLSTEGQADDHQLHAALMATTLAATTDTVVQLWGMRYPDADMVDLTGAALALIEPMWPDHSIASAAEQSA